MEDASLLDLDVPLPPRRRAKKKATKKAEPTWHEWGTGEFFPHVKDCEECQRVWAANPGGWITAGCRRCPYEVYFNSLAERNAYLDTPRENPGPHAC